MPRIQRRHVIEAAIVLAVLSSLLYIFLPAFHRSQVKSQTAGVQRYTELVLQQLTENPDFFQSIEGYSRVDYKKQIASLAMNESRTVEYECRDILLDTEKIHHSYPSLSSPRWLVSGINVWVTASYRKTDEGYSTEPFHFIVMAAVGNALPVNLFQTGSFTINKDSYFEEMKSMKPYEWFPFEPTNGLESNGFFHAQRFTSTNPPHTSSFAQNPNLAKQQKRSKEK